MIALMDNLVTVVTSGHIWSHWSLLKSRTSTMMALKVIIALCNLVTVVTPGHSSHNWSQVVTLVTVEV